LQTYSLLRWSQRPCLFQPFPSLHRSLRPASFSSQSNGSLRPHKDHHNLVSLALITKVLRTRNGEEEERSKNKSSKNTSKNSLSSHFLLGVKMGLGEGLILLDLCLLLIALALVLNVKSEKLGCLEVWWLGVFIAPTTKVAVGEAVCRWAHRTVRCATGHCLVRQPRHPTVRVRPLEL
jgi:hypothetical protein